MENVGAFQRAETTEEDREDGMAAHLDNFLGTLIVISNLQLILSDFLE